MSKLSQQFIIYFARNKRADAPNSFLESDIMEDLSSIGYELPSENNYEKYVAALNHRYPDRYMIPFAKSVSSDDTAGFLVNSEFPAGTIIEIHDFASAGYENPLYFNSFSSWLSAKKHCA